MGSLWNRNVPNRSHFSNIVSDQLPSGAMHFLQGREHGVRIVFMNGPLESIIECIFNPIGVKHIKKGLMVSPVFCVPPHSRTITHWQFPMIMFGTTSPPDCGPAQTEPAGCLPLRPPSACHGAPGHCAGSW